MARPAWRLTTTGLPRPRLEPVASPPGAGDFSAADRMVRTLDRLLRSGGIVTVDPPKHPYGFVGGTHTNVSQEIQHNLWRFDLSGTARNMLDHLTTSHDEHGIVSSTQGALAEYFGYSQSRVSRSLRELAGHHFTWKVRRGQLQVNPTYAYRFGSRKHQALLIKLGPETLEEHRIVIPLPAERS